MLVPGAVDHAHSCPLTYLRCRRRGTSLPPLAKRRKVDQWRQHKQYVAFCKAAFSSRLYAAQVSEIEKENLETKSTVAVGAKSVNGPTNQRTLRKDEYHVCLIHLPEKLLMATVGNRRLNGTFALLTKVPLPETVSVPVMLDFEDDKVDVTLAPVRKPDGERRILRLVGRGMNREMAEVYSKSFLHHFTKVENFTGYVWPEFWEEMLVMPVDMLGSQLWWGVVHQVINPDGAENLNKLKEMVEKEETDTKECSDLVKTITNSFFNKNDAVNDISDPLSLLQMFAIERNGVFGHLFSADGVERVKKQKGKRVITQLALRLHPLKWQNTSIEDIIKYNLRKDKEEELNNSQVTHVPLKQLTFIPIATEWLRLAMIMGRVVPWVFNYVRASWVQKQFDAVKDIPVSEICRAVALEKRLRTSYKRLVHMGNILYKYILASEAFIEKNGAISKTTHEHEISKRTRLEEMGQILPVELGLMFSGLEIDFLYPATWDRGAYDSPSVLENVHFEPWLKKEIPDPVTNSELHFMGRVLSGLVALCYSHGGIYKARRFCAEIGATDGKMLRIFHDLEGAGVPGYKYRYPWEYGAMESPIPKATAKQIWTSVDDVFQYRFNVWQRLAPAFVHFSKKNQSVLQFRAVEFLGEITFSVLVVLSLMETRPNECQTNLNRHFNVSAIWEVMGRIIFESKLEKFMVHNKESTHQQAVRARDFLSQTDDLHAISGFKPPKMWVELFKAIVGSLLLDTCFDLNEVWRILSPRVEVFFPSIIRVGETGELVKNPENFYRYIPTHITPRAFKKASTGNHVQLYGTLIEFMDALGSSPGENDHGFIALTPKNIMESLKMEMCYPPVATQSAMVTMTPILDESFSFSQEQLQLMDSFQYMYFEHLMIPSDCESISAGDYEKKYGILPVIRNVGSQQKGSWEINWDYVQHVVDGTLPDAWDRVLDAVVAGDMEDAKIEELCEQLALDRVFESPPTDWKVETEGESFVESKSTHPKLISAIRSIIWKTEAHLVMGLDIGNINDAEPVRMQGVFLNGNQLLNYVPSILMKSVSPQTHFPVVTNKLTKLKPTYMTLKAFRRANVLPSVLWRLEGLFTADDFQKAYSIPRHIPLITVLKWITNSQALDLDPEQDFIMGSAVLLYAAALTQFLKHTKLSPGELSQRQAAIMRAALAPEESAQKLAGHLISSPFYPHRRHDPWHPPGIKPFVLRESEDEDVDLDDMLNNISNDPQEGGDDDEESDHPLKKEKLKYEDGRLISKAAHPVSMGLVNYHIKAVAGGLYLAAGMGHAIDFLQTIKVVEKVRKPGPRRDRRVNSEILKEVERKLGYKFNDMSLLLEALCHPNMGGPVDYNRLEFIGDNAIEVLVVRYILDKHPSISLPDFNILKIASVTNDNLARMMMSEPFRLHRYLHHKSDKLGAELRAREQVVDKVKDKPPGQLGVTLPKVCGDVFESVAGAVLVDSGYCLDTVWEVIYPMMEEYLTKFVDDPSLVLENRELFM